MVDPTALISAAKEAGVLSEIYKDLAQPGVRQVGRALETVLQLGSCALLPLRLLNETARQYEQRKFEAIADRFAKIPEENIVDVSPELGVPIMDKLSITQDKTLQQMFVELLGKAADSSTVSLAHPSFVNVISSLSPDEAILLKSFRGMAYHPFVSIELKEQKGSGSTTVGDFVIIPPKDLASVDNIPLYLSNLIGLGILEARRGTHLTAQGAYDAVTEYAKKTFRYPETYGEGPTMRKVEYRKHVIVVLPYGQSFMRACHS